MKLKVNENLAVLLDNVVGSFQGASASNMYGGSVHFTAGFPYGVILSGPALDVPERGPNFLSGTVTRMELSEIIMPGARVIDRLTVSGIEVSALRLFDLTSRTATKAKADFDEGVFRSVLKGDWQIKGGGGADVIGPSAWMALAGDDRILAGGGDDFVGGGAGADTILGGSGNDWLWGGTGADVLAAGQGDDVLLGGGGADIFVFAASGGADEVADFNTAQDRLDLGAAGSFEVVDTSDGAQILFDGGSVLLRGVAAAEWSDDFLV